MSLTRLAAEPLAPGVQDVRRMDSAVVLGEVQLGPGAYLAQGAVIRSRGGAVSFGSGSALLENSVIVGSPESPVRVGRKTVFGHRCLIIGAELGDLCEVGNGSIILPGARLGSRCFLGEGTLVPAGTTVPDGAVIVGRPGHVIRRANEHDLERLQGLRDGSLALEPAVHLTFRGDQRAGAEMGKLYAYGTKQPKVASSATLFESAEVTGDVTIGEDSIIGAGVKIIGDSHGPVRIGARVQILENTVLHLLPDNALVIEDDVTIGPGAMIHGCHIGAGTVIEPGAIVCDGSVIGARSHIRAGALIKQRAHFGAGSVLEGFPAEVVAKLDAPPARPAWALRPEDLSTIVRIR